LLAANQDGIEGNCLLPFHGKQEISCLQDEQQDEQQQEERRQQQQQQQQQQRQQQQQQRQQQQLGGLAMVPFWAPADDADTDGDDVSHSQQIQTSITLVWSHVYCHGPLYLCSKSDAAGILIWGIAAGATGMVSRN